MLIDTGRLHPAIKQMLAFTHILRAIGSLSYYAVRELKDHGNPAMITRMFGMSVPATFATDEVKDYLRGRDDKDRDIFEMTVDGIASSGMLGLTGNLADNIMRNRSFGRGYTESTGRGVMDMLTPPALSSAGALFGLLTQPNTKDLHNLVPLTEVGTAILDSEVYPILQSRTE